MIHGAHMLQGVGNDERCVLLMKAISTGGTATSDKSRAGNGGIGHGISLINGARKTGSAYKFYPGTFLFDGFNDYGRIGSHADFNMDAGPWTIDFWVRPDHGGWHYLVSRGWTFAGGTGQEQFHISLDLQGGPDRLEFGGSSDGNAHDVLAQGTNEFAAPYTTWRHVAVCSDGPGGTIWCYVDGVLVAQCANPVGGLHPSTSSLLVASREPAPISELDGRLDCLRWSTDCRWPGGRSFAVPNRSH